MFADPDELRPDITEASDATLEPVDRRSLLFDALALLGLVLLTVGLWWLAPWLSLTVLGVLLIVAGCIGQLTLRREATERELARLRQHAGDENGPQQGSQGPEMAGGGGYPM